MRHDDPLFRREVSSGIRNMGLGALWLAIGLGVTLLTYGMAAGGLAGNRFFVAIGAILVGAVQFSIGLAQLIRARRDANYTYPSGDNRPEHYRQRRLTSNQICSLIIAGIVFTLIILIRIAVSE